MIIMLFAVIFLLLCTLVWAISSVSSLDKKREDEEQINFIKNHVQNRHK